MTELRMGLRPTYRNENRFGPVAIRIELAWDGQDRQHSGSVEAVTEFGPGGVFEPICVAPTVAPRWLAARNGV